MQFNSYERQLVALDQGEGLMEAYLEAMELVRGCRGASWAYADLGRR